MQAHWSPANYLGLQTRPLLEGLADCVDLGIASGVGLSNFGPIELRKAHAYFQSRGVPLLLNQFQCSLLSFSNSKSETIKVCNELGIVPFSYSTLGLGAIAKIAMSDRPRKPTKNKFRNFLHNKILAPSNSNDLQQLLRALATKYGERAERASLEESQSITKLTHTILLARPGSLVLN